MRGVALIAAAAAYATWAHRHQRRKQSNAPYIVHPVGVASLLWRCGYRDARLLAGALLHDVVEDTDCRVMSPPWPDDVVRLVVAATEIKAWPDGKPVPWLQRKARLLADAAWMPEAAALKAADLADNLFDVGRYGWGAISVGPAEYAVYADGLLRLVDGKLNGVLRSACELAGVPVQTNVVR